MLLQHYKEKKKRDTHNRLFGLDALRLRPMYTKQIRSQNSEHLQLK